MAACQRPNPNQKKPPNINILMHLDPMDRRDKLAKLNQMGPGQLASLVPPFSISTLLRVRGFRPSIRTTAPSTIPKALMLT